MDAEVYRQLQVDAVTGHGGTGEGEIIKVTSWLVVATLAWRLLNLKSGRLSSFLVEFSLLVIPQIILFCYPQWTRWLIASVAVPSLLLAPTSTFKGKGNNSNSAASAQSSPAAFLTSTRAAIMIMCVIGILAVDFPSVFPRRFAKTETVGTSLMDAGVGCVVVSYGLTAARYYSGSAATKGERRMKSSSLSLWNTMKSTVPLLALGIARMLAVKAINYQEHISEYGVHWNFFMTLGCLPVALWLVLGVGGMPIHWSFPTGCLLGIAYEVALQRTGLEAWMLFSGLGPETGLPFWLVANKEGLVSLVGYISLCLMSLGVGLDLMTGERLGGASWAVCRRVAGKLGMLVASYCLCTRWLGLQPSRRLMNFPFSIGSLALTTIQMMGFLLLDLLLPPHSDYDRVPMIAAGVSFNQLAFFLLANLLTGAINLTSYTLLQPPGISLAIIGTYMFILCCTVVYWYLGSTRLRL